MTTITKITKQEIERKRTVRRLLEEAIQNMTYIETKARMTRSPDWITLYWQYDQYIKFLQSNYHQESEVEQEDANIKEEKQWIH